MVETEKQVESSARLSCLHGGAESETVAAILANWKKLVSDNPIRQLYAEAVSRLPLADLPELLECLIYGGHCIGLLDPVSNIILNALNFLLRRPKRPPRLDLPPPEEVNWTAIANTSFVGLLAFMRTYFRHLTDVHATRVLHLARGDLAVAVRLVELELYGLQHSQYGLLSPASSSLPVDLSGDRAQFALKVAAVATNAHNPDDDDDATSSHDAMLVLFKRMLAPPEIRASLQALQYAIHQQCCLTVQEINGILEFLRWQQLSAAFQLSFQRRTDQLQCLVGSNYIAEITLRPAATDEIFSVSRTRSHNILNTKIISCLSNAAEMYTLIRPADAPATCDYIKFAKRYLGDTIHAFYLKAISLLPRDGRLHKHLRGILEAGYCYGIMDPVSNIILNSIWYTLTFPQLGNDDDEVDKDESSHVVLGIDDMLFQMEARSIDGLIAAVRASIGCSEHMAVERLCCMHCDLMAILKNSTSTKMIKALFNRAGQAAKNPRHADLAVFFSSLAPEKVERLRSLLTTGKGCVMPDGNLEAIYTLLSIVPAPNSSSAAAAGREARLLCQGRILQEKLEKLLQKYADQHCWEPIYKLDVICGVKKENVSPVCYHINFLASPCDSTTSTPARMLFFAEIWGLNSSAKQSDDPVPRNANLHCKEFCCPLPDYNTYHTYLGRCYLCEPDLSKIVHPPSGNHQGADCTKIEGLLDYMCGH